MSKFKNVLAAAREREGEAETGGEEIAAPAANVALVETPGAPSTPRPGRPRGKRSSGEHEQVTAYIRRDTYKRVKIALLQDEGQDFSELVEELLGQWLQARG